MADIFEHRGLSSIAMLLHVKIDESSKTQREIAKEIGYENPNVLSMMKHGDAKVPFEKVPALAKALNVDPGHLMRLAIEQYWPGLLDVIKRIFGNIVSENEMTLVSELRKAFHDTDPTFSTAQLEAVIALLKGFTPGSKG